MNSNPDADPADDDGTGSDGTAQPTILGPAEFTAKVLNGEIDPAEWGEI